MSPLASRLIVPPANLGDFSSPELIVPELQAQAPLGIIHELCTCLAQQPRFPRPEAVVQAVLAREKIATTAVGSELAIPHARLPGTRELVFAFGRTARPIPWGESPAVPVQLIFLLVISPDRTADYLALLSGFAKLTGDADLRARLHSARDATALWSVLRSVSLRSPK
jgi:nitrogen PTS system EIIA component